LKPCGSNAFFKAFVKQGQEQTISLPFGKKIISTFDPFNKTQKKRIISTYQFEDLSMSFFVSSANFLELKKMQEP
jgi:hypothetical protein